MQCPPMPTQAYGDVFAIGLPPIATRLWRRCRRSLWPGWFRPPQFSAPAGAVGGAAGCAYAQYAPPAECAYALPTKMPSAATTTTQRATRLSPRLFRARPPCDRSCCIRCSFASTGLIKPNGANGALQSAPDRSTSAPRWRAAQPREILRKGIEREFRILGPLEVTLDGTTRRRAQSLDCATCGREMCNNTVAAIAEPRAALAERLQTRSSPGLAEPPGDVPVSPRQIAREQRIARKRVHPSRPSWSWRSTVCG